MQGAQVLRNGGVLFVRRSDEGCSATPQMGFLRSRHSFICFTDRTLGIFLICSISSGEAGESMLITDKTFPPGTSLPNCIRAILILCWARIVPILPTTPGLSTLDNTIIYPSGTTSSG